MYVTGGIGYSERIPDKPYDLPQCLEDNLHRDIAETCASVAMMMFSWRLHAITGESRFFDVIENILYNHYLGAISMDHLGNFYYNPLRRVGDLTGHTDHHGDPVRRTRLPEIHSTTCCLPNAWRFFGQLPEYVFSVKDNGVAVNLYTDAVARHCLPDGTKLTIEMHTLYPHEGKIKLRISPERAIRFTLHLRIPAWCEKASVSAAGGKPTSVHPGRYYGIDRTWNCGEEVVLELPMRPVALFSHPEITANRNQIVFRRGPLIYCLEKQDAAGLDLTNTAILLNREDPSRSVTPEFDSELGLYILRAQAGRRRRAIPAGPYFRAGPLRPTQVREIKLIPFFFRANRQENTRWITFISYE